MADGPNDFFLLPCGDFTEEEAARVYVESLFAQKKKWEYLHLNYIPESSSVWDVFCQLFAKKGLDVSISKKRFFYFIDTTQNWDEYYNEFLHKKLRDVRGRINRLKRDGFSYEVFEKTMDIQAHLPEILKLYDERRESTGQKNAFNVSSHRKMLEEVVVEYQKKKWIKLTYLKGSDGNIWAYQLDFIKDGIQYHYTPTFDEKYKFYSPSKILLYESIKSAFTNPEIIEFNFMRGESPYKTQYAENTESYVSIVIKNQYSTRNRLTVLASYLTSIRDKIFNIRIC